MTDSDNYRVSSKTLAKPLSILITEHDCNHNIMYQNFYAHH